MEKGKVCECGVGGGGPSNPIAAAPFDGGEHLALGVECPEVEPPKSTDFITATLGLGLDGKMPFLQMLQTLCSTNMENNSLKAENQNLEVENCMPNLHSPVMSLSPKGGSEEKGELNNSVDEWRNDFRSVNTKPLLSCRKMMRKPKRAKVVVENKKDAEKQRITHITVERNRRRLISDYLIVLRSLLPHDYAPKGDQASIVGGVIDYVKKLEHHWQYLETRKRQKKMDEIRSSNSMVLTSETSNVVASTSTSSSSDDTLEEKYAKKQQLEKKADVNIMMVQTHANLHIECEVMKQSQLIQFLAALENLGLTILHLNINSMHNSSFYSLSLKVEEECKIRSAEEISSSVEKVLNSLNIYNGTRRSSFRNQNQDEARNVEEE